MIYPNEVCPVCNENPNLQYICESCHEVFCEDCVDLHTEEQFICVSCGSKQISFDKYDQPFCQECGNTELRSINKVIPTCRTCESTQVILIADKQKSLMDEYKTIITNSREFLVPIEKVMDKLHKSRNELFELRQEHPVCLHHPTLESDGLLLCKLYDNGKNRIYEQANRFFQEIQRNIHYINEIQVTHPSNLSYISEILVHFERERKKVSNLAKSEMEPLLTRLEPVEDKIAFMERMQALFNKFFPKLHLDPEERIVYGLNCKLSSGANSEQGFSNKNGTILITNQRIYFYHEQGLFKKQTVLLFSVKLDDLQAAEVKGKLKKKVSLQFLNSMYDFSLSKNKRELLVDWIERAKEFDVRNTLNDTQFKKFIKYRLTTKLFNEELENAIYNLVGYHGLRNSNQQTVNANSNIFNSHMFRASHLSNPNVIPHTPDSFPRSSRNNFSNNYRRPNNIPQNSYSSNYSTRPIQPTQNYPKSNPGSFSDNRMNHSGDFINPTNSQFGGYENRAFARSNLGHSTGNYNHQAQNFQNNHQTYQTMQYPNSRNISPSHPYNNHGYPNSNPWSTGESNPRFNYPSEQNLGDNKSSFASDPPYGRNPTQAKTYFNRNEASQSYPRFNSGDQYQAPFPKPSNTMKSSPLGTDFPDPNSPYSKPETMPSSFNSEEMNIRAELERLRSDEYAFQNTIRKLEFQYDRGVISNQEFVRAYQDLQRELYIITNKISRLESFLKENYGL